MVSGLKLMSLGLALGGILIVSLAGLAAELEASLSKLCREHFPGSRRLQKSKQWGTSPIVKWTASTVKGTKLPLTKGMLARTTHWARTNMADF